MQSIEIAAAIAPMTAPSLNVGALSLDEQRQLLELIGRARAALPACGSGPRVSRGGRYSGQPSRPLGHPATEFLLSRSIEETLGPEASAPSRTEASSSATPPPFPPCSTASSTMPTCSRPGPAAGVPSYEATCSASPSRGTRTRPGSTCRFLPVPDWAALTCPPRGKLVVPRPIVARSSELFHVAASETYTNADRGPPADL
jgi:hypothetical protein